MTGAPVLIAGGGIGGLAAALALARAGVAVRLFEKAPVFSAFGAGLQISPNASRILRSLQLDHYLDPALGKPDSLVVSSGPSGALIVEMPLGDSAEKRWNAPSWVIHRADLVAALAEAAAAEPRIELSMGRQVVGVTDGADGVRATVSDGERTTEIAGDVLIGADGLWSKVRREIVRDGPPSDTGRCACRAMVPVERVPARLRANSTGLWLGPDAHLVHYPLRGGAIVNLVAIVRDDRAERGWSVPATAQEVDAHFARWADLPRELVRASSDWTRWTLYDRAPETRWPGTRCVLAGDAAHPMVPFLAQGASMAIEDAACLARHLAQGDTVAALARYRAERLPRVARVQAEARRNGTVFHLGEPFASARDLALRVLGGSGLAARYDWLYGA